MHHLSTSFVLGYHGCDKTVGETLLSGKTNFQLSNNDYDWLGPGVYFWESDPERAYEFAVEKKRRGDKIKTPFVVGAVIDMGYCLDLTTKSSIEAISNAHLKLTQLFNETNQPLPVNGPEKWSRRLDCAVIKTLHSIIESTGEESIDTVRGIFFEGGAVYDGSEFNKKTHSQISVVNLNQIKAVFRVPKS